MRTDQVVEVVEVEPVWAAGVEPVPGELPAVAAAPDDEAAGAPGTGAAVGSPPPARPS